MRDIGIALKMERDMDMPMYKVVHKDVHTHIWAKLYSTESEMCMHTPGHVIHTTFKGCTETLNLLMHYGTVKYSMGYIFLICNIRRRALNRGHTSVH